MNKSRLAVFATAASLLATMLVSIPTAAQATTVCEYEVNATTGDFYNHCVGKTADGSNVELREPLDYNGTVFVWSHGYRYATNLPPGISPPGGTTPGAMAAKNELANSMPPVPPVTESFQSYGGKDKNFGPV